MRSIREDGTRLGPFCMMDGVTTPGQALVREPAEAVATVARLRYEVCHDRVHGLSFPRIGIGAAALNSRGPLLTLSP